MNEHIIKKEKHPELVIRWTTEDYRAEFEVFQVTTFTMDYEYADLERLIHGQIKWDGCSDFTIGEGEDYQLHCCGKEFALLLQRAFDFIYDVIGPTIKKWII